MKLRLKEQPVEWVKFTGVMTLLASLIAFVLWRKGLIDRAALYGLLGLSVATVLTSVARPRWFRGFYRCGMTASWHVGQVMGRILLTLVFLVFVTPMGWLLRLAGKDLLGLKRTHRDSYWQKPSAPGPFDRLF